MNVVKGTKVRIRALVAQKLGTYSIAGAQAKVSAREVNFVGTVAHVRGDDPTNPIEIWFWVVPDDPSTFEEFRGLEVESTLCPKCNRVEIGPLNPSAIVGIGDL